MEVEVASLGHETWNDPMENAILIPAGPHPVPEACLTCTKRSEILTRYRKHIVEQMYRESPDCLIPNSDVEENSWVHRCHMLGTIKASNGNICESIH